MTLTEEQRQELVDVLKKGKASARTIRRAYTLLLADSGQTDSKIAKILLVSIPTVERTRKQWVEARQEATLTEQPRPQ